MNGQQNWRYEVKFRSFGDRMSCSIENHAVEVDLFEIKEDFKSELQ